MIHHVRSKRKLKPHEQRLLEELAEPNSNPGNVWYFPLKNLRSLLALSSLGLAKEGESDLRGRRFGFSITRAGRLALRTGHL